MSEARTLACPDCGKKVADPNGLAQHRRWAHGVDLRKRPRKKEDEEESLADIAVAAHGKRLAGERLDPLEESLTS